MAHETLADVENEQQHRKSKAVRYDHLRTSWNDNCRRVERLDSQEKGASTQVKILQRIIEEANKLPDSVVHNAIGYLGGCAVPNGVTKLMIIPIANSALSGLLHKEEQRVVQLEAAKKARDEFKQALKDEFDE